MSDLRRRLEKAILDLPAVDCHSHIPPAAPHARRLSDLLGYHYYTELVHSAGMPAEALDPSPDERERTAEMVARLATIDNTVQYSWLLEAARALFGFGEDAITPANWEALDAAVVEAGRAFDRYREVLKAARIEKVFLTNSFDEPLEEVDRDVFVPCLRTDDLVFHLPEESVRKRLAEKTGMGVETPGDLRKAVGALFEYFASREAAGGAISLPPTFTPVAVEDAAVEPLLAHVARGRTLDPPGARLLERFVFGLVAEGCRDAKLPFQLMIGVYRDVYPAGVEGGRDLLSAEGTLMQYADLFRRFPTVDFTVSVLSMTWAHELATFAWIFPNVKPSGHWWYANVPVHIEAELRARLQAVPKTKLIGYYSDAYKVEFCLPKFNMYRRVLAGVLAGDFVETGRMTEETALETAGLLLRENPSRIFGLS